MALQSSFYNTDGSTRTYPSTKHIATKQHVAVWRKRVVDSIYEIVPVSEFQLVNNSVVFDVTQDQAIYSEIEVRVADTADELGTNPSEVGLVAGSIGNINIVAADIDNVNINATNIASINSVSATVVPNISEILLADNNATIATVQAGLSATSANNAQLRAWEAEAEKMTADSYANEAEDVFVKLYTSDGDGTFTSTNSTDYSSYHWSLKAETIGNLTIDATPTDASSNPVSSNGVFDALVGKADTSSLTSYLDKAGGTMTGAITAIAETKVAMGANAIALASGNVFTKTISGATTLTVSGWLATGNANSFILELTNGGSAVVTYPAGSKFAGGTAPTLTASGKDILGCYSHDAGTTLNWIVLGKDVK